MMTLRELKHAVENAEFADRVPTYRALRESGIPIVAQEVDSHGRIAVYQNGFVSYQVGRRSTVFPLHACSVYTYEFGQKEHFLFEEGFFENKSWYFRVVLEGEDRIAKNEDWRNSRKSISYSAIAEDWGEMAQEDKRMHDFIYQEEVEQLLSLATEKQRMVMKKYYMEQMREDEIAEELGITQQAVSDMLRKGIRRVRKKVG